MAEEDVDWGMDEDFDPWQGAEEQSGVAAVESHPNGSVNERNARTMQDREGGLVGNVENTTESQQRPVDQFAHLPIGWTRRASRHHPGKQYFYNPYTRAAIWDQPEEPVFDESGISTPPLPQPQQEPPASLQIRSTGRLTDHMKMAPIRGAPDTTTSSTNTVQRDTYLDRSSGNSTPQAPPTTSKLRLIDRIQPARYVPPEKHETISLRPQNGPSPRPGAGSSYRPDYAAEPRAGGRDSPRTGDSYRPERVQTSSPALTFRPQVSTASTEGTMTAQPQVKDDGFASQKHVEKMPEWLEANDPKLDSEVPSDRRRAREQEDASSRSGSSKRARFDRDARPSPNNQDPYPPASARAPPFKDQDPPRGDSGNVSHPSSLASNSRSSVKPNSRDMPPAENMRIRNVESASANPATPVEPPRQAPSDRGPPARETPNSSRALDPRENDRAKIDDQGSAPPPFADRPAQSPAGPLESRVSRNSPPPQRRPLPPQMPLRDGHRSGATSGANNAPLLANRWNASPRTSSAPEVRPAAVPEQVKPEISVQAKPAIVEEDKPREHAYGPKANKNLAMQSRSDNEPRRSSGAPPAANQRVASENNSARSDWRQSASSQPSSARSFQEPKDHPDSRGRNEQAVTNYTDVSNANQMPLGASAVRDQPKYRVTEPTPASAPMTGVFRSQPSARDAPNGDVRTGPTRAPSPPGPSSARSARTSNGPSAFTPDSKRGDGSYGPPPNTRTPLPPARTRSPVPHLPPQARAFNQERRSPPRMPVPRRRSPSPPRFGPGPPRLGDRRDDRPIRPHEGYAPNPSSRDDTRPHPRGPDLYSPGGNSPPRQHVRGPPPFLPRDDLREPRSDPRRGRNDGGPVRYR